MNRQLQNTISQADPHHDVSQYEAYFFDLDGTIYTGNELLPGAAQLTVRLLQLGKRVMYLTNTTVYTRRQCQARLQAMGLELDIEDILTAGYVSARYLLEESEKQLVFVIGEQALEEELMEAGISLTNDPLLATDLVVGLDRNFTYEKMAAGMTAVRNGARFIVANPDPFCPVPGGVIPDSWPIAKAIEAASTFDIEVMTGKPSAFFTGQALIQSGLDASHCLMIGDRLETDMMMGEKSGMDTALVLTGVAKREHLNSSDVNPTYVFDTLEQMLAKFPLPN